MEYATGANAPQVDINTESGIRWSAVFAGWVVASGMAFLLYVAGLAIGFAAFDPYNAAATAKGVGIGTAVWIVLTWAVSSFLGGMFASWFDGKADRTSGALHGVTVWGLSIAVSVLVFALGATQAAQGGARLVRSAATVGAAAAGPASNAADDATTGLQALLTQRIAQTNARPPAEGAQTAGAQVSAADVRRAADQLDRQTMASVAGALLKGDTENAKALLAANTSMSQAEIDQTLQSVSAQVDKFKAQAQAAAERAAHYTAMAMWVVFFSSLLALVAAAFGGWLGAGHIHRVYHLRRFETTTARQP
jgi:hypothetical protein